MEDVPARGPRPSTRAVPGGAFAHVPRPTPRALARAIRTGAAALAMVSVAMARPARAEAPEAPIAEVLRVEPNACFDAAALVPHVASWLGRATVDRRIAVEVRGQPRSAEGIDLTVRRDGLVVGGRRFPRLEAPCEEVRAAVGLAVSLAIDATILDALAAPRPPAPPTPPPPSPPVPTPPTPTPAPPPARAFPGVSAALEAAAVYGALPGPVAGAAPAANLALSPRFELRFSGLFTAESSTRLRLRTVSSALAAGRIDACAAFPVGLARGRACMGALAGQLRTDTTGPTFTYSPAAPWVAAAVRFDLRVPFTAQIGAVLSTDILVPFLRANLEVLDASGATAASRRLSPVGGSLGIGPSFIFR
jgi:hypothetical protein